MNTENRLSSNGRRSLTLSVAAILFASVFMAAGAAVPALGASPPLNNVQVFVATTSALQYSYYFSAYNLTGSLVASSESSYPGAGFELPGGSYLFTVSAVNQQSGYCELCAQPMSSGGTTSGSASSGSAIIAPIYQQLSEYGFKVLDVSGPASFTIATLNATSYPTTSVTVRVAYANGTAAAGAYVSASVIGEWYYWWGPNSTVVMSGQTDSNGAATLVVPSAPAVVSAWKWVQVNMTGSQKSPQVSVGGEKVNVSTPWQTTYLGLAGTGLLLPPATSVQLTLQYQQSDFWAVPLGGAVTSSSGAAVSNATSGAPSQTIQGSASQYYLPDAIPSIRNALGSTTTTSAASAFAWGSPVVEGVIVIAAAVAVLGVTAVVLLRRHASP